MGVLPINLYRNFLLTQTETQLAPGIAAAFGSARDLSNWTNAGIINGKTIYTITGDAAGEGGFVLSGGGTIYNSAVSASVPWAEDAETDWRSNEYQYPTIYNPQFFGAFEYDNVRYCSGIGITAAVDFGSQIAWRFRLYTYTQTPDDASGSSRSSWAYASGFYDDSYFDGKRCVINNDSIYTLVKVYTLYIGEDEYFLFAFGVAPDGSYFYEHGSIFATLFIAINKDLWKDKVQRPWVGDESEPDEETGFLPSDEPSDNVTARTDFNTNPYSINSGGSGIKVIFPEYVYGSYYTLMGDIISGIYQGSNEGFINRVEQVWAELVNGNTNRAAEEIQAILNGILFYHTIPVLTTYSSEYHSFRTICGYNVINAAKSVAKASASIFSRTFYSDIITPRLNCFLDYDPYTSMIIKVPFCPSVSVSPSAVYGKVIKAVYKIDIVTGILHCDISIYSASHEYIIHSCEANVKTDIPIMGQGANGGGLEKITGALLGAANGDYSAAMVGALDAVAGKSRGEAVGKMSTDGIGAYLSSRSAYLIATYPKAAIPTQEEDGAPVGGFLWQQGMASATAEKVGYYSGGFAKFSSVDLSQVQATQAEKEDIEARLKEGVYL